MQAARILRTGDARRTVARIKHCLHRPAGPCGAPWLAGRPRRPPDAPARRGFTRDAGRRAPLSRSYRGTFSAATACRRPARTAACAGRPPPRRWRRRPGSSSGSRRRRRGAAGAVPARRAPSGSRRTRPTGSPATTVGRHRPPRCRPGRRAVSAAPWRAAGQARVATRCH